MPPIRRLPRTLSPPLAVVARTVAAARRATVAALAAAALLATAAPAAADCTVTSLRPGPARLLLAQPLGLCDPVRVTATPANPVAPGTTVTFDATDVVGASEETIVAYAWDFDGDGAEDLRTDATEPTATHVYPARGRQLATVRALGDGDAVIASASVEVVVTAAPVAALAIVDPPASGLLRPHVAYTFSAVGSTADGGAPTRYVWSWGDGATSTTAVPTADHAFAGDGASTGVSVTVYDDLDWPSAPATVAVEVRNLRPLAELTATPATVAVGERLTLDATGSSDPDGAIAEYRWDLDADGSFETSTGLAPTVRAGGYPNPGVLYLRVRVVDDSGDGTVATVPVTVVGAGGSSGGGSSGGDGSGSGGGPGGGDGSGGPGGGTGGSGSGSGGGSGGSGGSGADGSGGSGSGGSGSGGSGSGGSGGSGASGGGGSGADSAGAGGDAFAVGLTGAAIQRLKVALRRGVRLRARANRAATGRLTLTLAARDARRLGLAKARARRPVKIGARRLRLAPGRTAKPAIKLTRRAAAALRRARPRTLRVTVRGTLSATGDRATPARVVLLRR